MIRCAGDEGDVTGQSQAGRGNHTLVVEELPCVHEALIVLGVCICVMT
jgi:hypothetical protein